MKVKETFIHFRERCASFVPRHQPPQAPFRAKFGFHEEEIYCKGRTVKSRFQYTFAHSSCEIVAGIIHPESSNDRSIIFQSSSSPPHSDSRIPPPHLHRSSVSSSLCLNYNFLGLSKQRAITIIFRQTLLSQTPETSLRKTA